MTDAQEPPEPPFIKLGQGGNATLYPYMLAYECEKDISLVSDNLAAVRAAYGPENSNLARLPALVAARKRIGDAGADCSHFFTTEAVRLYQATASGLGEPNMGLIPGLALFSSEKEASDDYLWTNIPPPVGDEAAHLVLIFLADTHLALPLVNPPQTEALIKTSDRTALKEWHMKNPQLIETHKVAAGSVLVLPVHVPFGVKPIAKNSKLAIQSAFQVPVASASVFFDRAVENKGILDKDKMLAGYTKKHATTATLGFSTPVKPDWTAFQMKQGAEFAELVVSAIKDVRYRDQLKSHTQRYTVHFDIHEDAERPEQYFWMDMADLITEMRRIDEELANTAPPPTILGDDNAPKWPPADKTLNPCDRCRTTSIHAVNKWCVKCTKTTFRADLDKLEASVKEMPNRLSKNKNERDEHEADLNALLDRIHELRESIPKMSKRGDFKKFVESARSIDRSITEACADPAQDNDHFDASDNEDDESNSSMADFVVPEKKKEPEDEEEEYLPTSDKKRPRDDDDDDEDEEEDEEEEEEPEKRACIGADESGLAIAFLTLYRQAPVASLLDKLAHPGNNLETISERTKYAESLVAPGVEYFRVSIELPLAGLSNGVVQTPACRYFATETEAELWADAMRDKVGQCSIHVGSIKMA